MSVIVVFSSTSRWDGWTVLKEKQNNKSDSSVQADRDILQLPSSGTLQHFLYPSLSG